MELGRPFLQAIYRYVLTDETEKVYRLVRYTFLILFVYVCCLEFFEIDV